jgi:hypothetical protein
MAPVIGDTAQVVASDGAHGEPLLMRPVNLSSSPARLAAKHSPESQLTTAESFHTASLLGASRPMFLLFAPLSEATADSSACPLPRKLLDSYPLPSFRFFRVLLGRRQK